MPRAGHPCRPTAHGAERKQTSNSNHIKKTKGKATKINTKEMGIKTTIPIKKTTLVEIGLKKIIIETTVAATVNPILNLMGS